MAVSAPLLELLLRRPEPRAGLVVGVVAALVLHLAVIPGSAALPVRTLGTRPGFVPTAVALTTTSAAQQRLDVSITSSADARAQPLAQPVEVDPRGQVVALPARVAERPLAADFLADTDQKTERETRARITGVTPNHTRSPADGSTPIDPVPGDGPSVKPQAMVRGAQRQGGPDGDGGAHSGDATAWDSANPGGGAPRLALEIPYRKKTTAFDLEQTENGRIHTQPAEVAVDGNSERLRLVMGQQAGLGHDVGQGEGAAGVGRLGGSGDDGDPGRIHVPSMGQIERWAGLPANDHLLLEEANDTSLNAFQWKHATYFNRMADAIRRVWIGGEVLGKNDPDGRVFGFEDRTTTVEVTVDTAGNVVDLVVIQPSGAGPLDDEALRSFRSAGPFPHPPEGLFKGRDRFSFSFGFAVNYRRHTVDFNWRPY